MLLEALLDVREAALDLLRGLRDLATGAGGARMTGLRAACYSGLEKKEPRPEQKL